MGLDADGFPFEMLLSPKSNVPVSVNIGLLNMPLSSVQAIYYDVDKKVYVNIILRSNHYELPENRNKFAKFLIEKGYAQPQEYFTPNYADYTSSVFKKYGALDWKANISVGADIPTSVTVPIKNQEELLLYVEGMSADGSLISISKEFRTRTSSQTEIGSD
ncbi:hypothetical protein [Flagellimonas lutaonensis]|uniref:hypothetical protein n=1 Tax=Flagellimonas lutaonensis TaxID=516051 RepID=UPI0005F7F42F|nr:hypothetical protein [Allomuricauda lutaonensis]